MELRQLSYFVAVSEKLHFGRAAMRVNVAQPALSTQVQAMEKGLNVQLSTRLTRKVQLTRAGEVFYDRYVRMLGELDLSAELARAAGGRTMREIRIGTIYPATTGALPAFLARIARKFPDIHLHVSNGSTSETIRQLECGKLNWGFIRPVENIGSLRFFSIAHERYFLAVPSDNPLASKSEVTTEDLKAEKIIAFKRQNLSHTERSFTETFEAHGLDENVAYTCDDTFSLISLVSSGLGVGFATEWMAALPGRDVVLKKVTRIDLKIGLGVAWSKYYPTAARDDIIDIARTLGRPSN